MSHSSTACCGGKTMICLSVCPSCSPGHMSTCSFVCLLSAYPSSGPSICPPTYPFLHLSCPSIQLYMSKCWSIHKSICPTILVYLLVHLCLIHTLIQISTRLSIHPFIFASIYPSELCINLSIHSLYYPSNHTSIF